MGTRVLSIADLLTSASAPTGGPVQSNSLTTYATDALFVTGKGSAAADGDLYLNTTDKSIHYYYGGKWYSSNAAIQEYASDAAYVTANGTAVEGSFYLNSVDLSLHFYVGGSWKNTASAPPSSLIWRLISNGPSENDSGNLEVLDFDYLSAQEIWATIVVPSSYVAGVQIFLTGGLFSCTLTSGNVKFNATAYLVRAASTVLGTYANSYVSTNAQVAVPGVASQVKAVGNVDLTSASGQINSVAVAAGDILLVKLIRDTTNETSGAAADARLFRFSMTPKFTA